MDNIEIRKQHEIFKSIFHIACANKYDFIDFAQKFLLSERAEEILLYSNLHYFNPVNVYNQFLESYRIKRTSNNNIINAIIVDYVSHIYVHFFNRTGEKMRTIMKYLPIETIINRFDLLHTLSEERVIFLSKLEFNIKMNNIRKYRSSHNKNVFQEENKKLLFIAKSIYLKMFYYPEIKNATYGYEMNFGPYLYNNNNLFFTVTKLSSINNLVETISNQIFIQKKYQFSNNIICLFMKEDAIEINNVLKNKLIKYFNQSIPFDKIIIICRRKLYFINNSEGIVELYYNFPH